jgi:hypothetical protein
MVLLHTVSHHWGVPLGPVTLANGTIANGVPFRTLSSLYFPKNWPHIIIKFLPPQGSVAPTSAMAAAILIPLGCLIVV